ncbi:hypothetical protein V6N12_028709 [Hibiscus sabdariffa]|uniref:RNase H type-1 domain-containing protein n=1 Tax=Hibiscus sabdariffa TaxID=183260 RepID=A0ABR2F6K6_9ROSI
MVKDILLPNVKVWNHELTESTFNSNEADAIWSIPLPKSNLNEQVCRGEYLGVYSIRSGIATESKCPQCNKALESIPHIFQECDFTDKYGADSAYHGLWRLIKLLFASGWNVNVDACYSPTNNIVFSGAIIRNDKGLVMGLCVKVQSGFSSVFMAEAKVAAHGLSFAVELGFHHDLGKRFEDANSQTKELKG